MSDIQQKIIGRIKEEKIRPAPRWSFLLRDYSIWLAFFVSLVVGGFAFCIIIGNLMGNDWDIYPYLGRSFSAHLLSLVPYFWIILLGIFLWLALFNFQHTRSGYRSKGILIFGLSILGSALLGILLHQIKNGEEIEEMIAQKFPIYQTAACCHLRQDVWSSPEKGLLSGSIMNVASEREFELQDWSGLMWIVEKDENLVVAKPVRIESGEMVKMIGKKKAEREFLAKEIRPWKGRSLSPNTSKK